MERDERLFLFDLAFRLGLSHPDQIDEWARSLPVDPDTRRYFLNGPDDVPA